jgi:hypothetical protein
MATIPSLALIPSGYKGGSPKGTLYSVLPTDGTGDFDFTRSGNATRINKEGLIEVVGNNVPRLNYPLIDGVVNGCPSLKLEPSRTNLITYSEDFSNAAWSKNNLTVTSGVAISPDGSLNADLLNFTSSGNYIDYPGTITIGQTYTVSCYVKSAVSSNQTFNIYGNANKSPGSITATSEWQRFTHTFTADITAMSSGITSAALNQLYVWGFQLEAGSHPTSYIPTSGSIATRSAETCNNAGDVNTFNDSEGVLFAEVSTFADNTYKRISLNSGSYVNSVVFDFIDDNNLYGKIFAGGSPIATILASGLNIENNNKLAFKYKQNDFALWVNGIQVGVDPSGSTPSGLNTLSLDLGGNEDFYGNTKQIQYFPTALNDTDLETLTSWDSFSDMAIGQLYTIE